MTSMTTLPFGRPLTRADLEDLPTDDGRRYELIDGVLIVSPGPELPHQDIVGNLFLLLRAGCPADLKVVLAPFAVALSDDAGVQSYWPVDPVDVSVRVLELVEGVYVERAHVVGDETYEVALPWPMALTPSSLPD